MNDSIGIAGAGRVARALGRFLAEAGEPVVCVASRNRDHAKSAAAFIGSGAQAVTYSEFPSSVSRIIVAVPDRALPQVAMLLAEQPHIRVALHTSGNRGPDALAALQARGVHCGTLHPLQTVTGDLPGVSALQGIAFAVSGDAEAVAWATSIVALAHGEILRIPPDLRTLYHAAAVIASNYVITLIDAGQILLEQCGIEPQAALRALGPLVRTAVENALNRGPVQALTGPIERGDCETVADHLRALPDDFRELYRSAGLRTLTLAESRGLDADRVRELAHLLK